MISQGGNFNLVTLGLGEDDQPLAIKRVPSEHCVCKILKSLINPLLGRSFTVSGFGILTNQKLRVVLALLGSAVKFVQCVIL